MRAMLRIFRSLCFFPHAFPEGASAGVSANVSNVPAGGCGALGPVALQPPLLLGSVEVHRPAAGGLVLEVEMEMHKRR